MFLPLRHPILHRRQRAQHQLQTVERINQFEVLLGQLHWKHTWFPTCRRLVPTAWDNPVRLQLPFFSIRVRRKQLWDVSYSCICFKI